MGAVLVHIDLDGDRPHPSSLAALAAGRAVASSWGATLYAALVVEDASSRGAPDSTARVVSTVSIPTVDKIQRSLARAGADKVVVALTDTPVLPLWGAIGGAWQAVIDHLRPRLVLFGAESPSAAELGPRTGARIGARLLLRARAVGVEDVELRDRDGGYVRASDGGAAVVLIGGSRANRTCDDDVELVVLVVPGAADPRIELAGSSPAEVVHSGGAVVAIGDDVVDDPSVTKQAAELARLLGAHLVGGTAASRAGIIGPGGVIERGAPLAPEVCVLLGSASLDLSGSTSLVRLGSTGGRGVDGSLAGPVGTSVAELCLALEDT